MEAATFGPQRRRQHLPGTVPDQLIQQRHRFLLHLRTLLTNYREHRRTFPPSVGALALQVRTPAAPDLRNARNGRSTGSGIALLVDGT